MKSFTCLLILIMLAFSGISPSFAETHYNTNMPLQLTPDLFRFSTVILFGLRLAVQSITL